MAFGSGSRKRRRSEDDEDIHVKADGEDIDAGEEGVIELNDEKKEQAQAAGKINPLIAESTMLGGEKERMRGFYLYAIIKY